MEMEPLLTTDEVATHLRVDVVTVRRLVARGELSAYRIGGEYRFAQGDLLAYLRRQRRPARAADPAPPVVPPLLRAQDIERLTPLFTRRARRCLALACEEAQAAGHGYLGTEHLLLGLLREEASAAARALAETGITLHAAREALAAADELPERAGASSPGELAATEAVREALHHALAQSGTWEHSYVGTEHVLYGLTRAAGANSTLVLELLGTAPDMVEVEVLRLLQGKHQ